MISPAARFNLLITVLLLLIISLFLTAPSTLAIGGPLPPSPSQGTSSTDTAQSNCVLTAVGKPPQNQTLPAGCDNGSGAARWPFSKKDPTQFRRIDQGWDLQGSSPQKVYAVATGKFYLANADPSGFGDYYPYEHLSSAVKIQGRSYSYIYYGHVHYAPGVLGQVKSAGQEIAYTYAGCCWPANWLEIGFGNSLPVGQGAYPTTAGLDMEQYLNGTRKDYQ